MTNSEFLEKFDEINSDICSKQESCDKCCYNVIDKDGVSFCMMELVRDMMEGDLIK